MYSTNFPKGASDFIIAQLRKSADNSLDALTEIIDDCIEALGDNSNAKLSITHDPLNRVLTIDELNNGCGMTLHTLTEFFGSFKAHNFVCNFISRFGLGRWYTIAKIPNVPNIHIDTSVGDGVLLHADFSVDGEEWNTKITQYPCHKNVRGSKFVINDVNEDEFPSDDVVVDFLSKHYAYTNIDILYNGVSVGKNDPLYLDKLPNGCNTPDGLYVKDGIIHKIVTEKFVDSDGNEVVLRAIATSITAQALYGWITDNKRNMIENSAEMGGIYTCVGSNLLNKGNNGNFVKTVLTRGGSGITRLFLKIIKDDTNVLKLNDVKARGFANFFINKENLNQYSNKRGDGLYNFIENCMKICKSFYNLVGQKKHETLNDDEIYTRVENMLYPTAPKKGTARKISNKLKKYESAKIHIDAIHKFFDFETVGKGLFDVTIPNNENLPNIKLNSKMLPDNFSTLTKEDILLSFAKFLIEDIQDKEIFNKFNQSFAGHEE